MHNVESFAGYFLTRLAARWRCLSPAERQEATARCANRRLPVSFKALIRRGSRLAVMHANDDSLGVRSASVSGSDAEGRPLEVRQSARPTFFIWSRCDCGHSFSKVSSDTSGSADKSLLVWQSSHSKPQRPTLSVTSVMPYYAICRRCHDCSGRLNIHEQITHDDSWPFGPGE
jgi:hypothetical protein